MAINQTVAPTVEPITTEDAKAHLRVTASVDDREIDQLIAAARHYVEQVTWSQLITATWQIVLDEFPASNGPILVPRSPLQSVTSVTYTDTDGNTGQTVASSVYTVDAISKPGRIEPKSDQTWPDTDSELNVVTATVVCGYGASGATVPPPILHAMRLLIGHWYLHRESVVIGTITSEVPDAVDALLTPYRIYDERVLEFV